MMKEGGRSAAERERTKMRERQRRSITTNIFHGLRKHGGYRLSPRADINEVLRHLAHEAGWTVHPDGTTYRSPAGASSCPLCGCGGRRSAAATPSCSFTTASPRVGDSGDDTLLAIYMSSTAAPAPAPPPGHHHLYLLRDSHTPVSSNHNTPPPSP